MNLPTYWSVIGKENARDLSLISKNMDAKKYSTVEAVLADVRLMVQNAITFNGAGSDVAIAGKQLQSDFEKSIAEIKKKRKSTSSVKTANSSKKARH